MEFDANPADQVWYWGSTAEFPCCIVPEVVTPPPCPDQVAQLLHIAAEAHMAGNLKKSLSAYYRAREVWLDLSHKQSLSDTRELRPEEILYLAAAIGSVMSSMGRDLDALALYRDVLSEAEKLEEGHPDGALVHGCLGSVHFHRMEYEKAFRSFVHCKVLREASRHLGVNHPDSAMASNNLACCLERLGKPGRARELMQHAHQVLRRGLGPSHPRTCLVARNMSRTGNKRLGIQIPDRIKMFWSAQMKANQPEEPEETPEEKKKRERASKFASLYASPSRNKSVAKSASKRK
eukprot:gene5593-6780_t